MYPKKLAFPQESQAWGWKNMGTLSMLNGENFFQKQQQQQQQNHFAGDTRANAVMVAGPHPGQDCLVIYPLP